MGKHRTQLPFDRRSLQQRLQSTLSDGEQVGPAPAKPVNDQVQQRTAKQLGAGARIAHQGPVPQGTIQRPDTREQSNLIGNEQSACKRGGVHTQSFALYGSWPVMPRRRHDRVGASRTPRLAEATLLPKHGREQIAPNLNYGQLYLGLQTSPSKNSQ